jgi:hypothetical protein
LTSLADGSVRLAVIVIDGLPCELLDRAFPQLPFLSSRTPHRSTAVSCFPSTTGPAYFPLLAGVTPGRANVTGIRWFDRTRPTRSRFPHRGLRSYVGPDAGKLASDTKATTIYDRHAWPVSTPVNKDSPKGREKSRDLLWVYAHFTHQWEVADRRTAWKLGRALEKERPIVFAVFPSVDELGHTKGFEGGDSYRALIEIDLMLAEKLGDFDGDILVTADHGLTATSNHIDLRAVVEEEVGSTIAFPLTGKPDPEAVVCESGNAMANVYLRGEDNWGELPSPARARELAERLIQVEGIDSIAIRGADEASAELHTREGFGSVRFRDGRFDQHGDAFAESFEGLTPLEALERSYEERNPDAAFALTSLFASERAGDLLVSASLGWDLRTAREWPEHHASHGALHRDHTVVPVLSSQPLPERRLRTIDLFSETLRLAGIPLDEYPDSDSYAIEAGTWAPGVVR